MLTATACSFIFLCSKVAANLPLSEVVYIIVSMTTA